MSYPTQDGVRFFTHSGRSWPSSDVYTRTLPDAHGRSWISRGGRRVRTVRAQSPRPGGAFPEPIAFGGAIQASVWGAKRSSVF